VREVLLSQLSLKRLMGIGFSTHQNQAYEIL
jgi:hypothetical protein